VPLVAPSSSKVQEWSTTYTCNICFENPYTSLILFGAIPKPVQAPAVVVFESYKWIVPKSTSNNEP
jgi:hypothetical protein